jgi:hypothetical protein
MQTETILVGTKKELLDHFLSQIARFDDFNHFVNVGDKREPREDLKLEVQLANISRTVLRMGAVFYLEIVKVTPDDTAVDAKAIPTIDVMIKSQYVRILSDA